ITLELTEGVLIKNAKLALQKIQHLVSLGFEISIDDFGTGYSSLSYLQKLPIHELKIDQTFIKQVPGNIDDEAIVNSIIQLASSKQLKIVAEGVETNEQAQYLINRNPEMVLQGYLFSQPLPAVEFEQQLIKSDARHKTA
ncbi:MAG: EAL domain-containing protein, partial [Hydrogenovibrio crunogenus]|nr:EAL domain-containing protein [Hydrogenovibrio crunogenus]